MASGRFFGSAYDGVDDGEFTDGEGTLADAVENRSGVVDRVRPLPIRRSWRSCHSAARVRPKAGIPKISCEPPASIDSSCCWPPRRFIIVAAHKTPSRGCMARADRQSEHPPRSPPRELEACEDYCLLATPACHTCGEIDH